MGRFDGQVAWITGASSGIGREMARDLARQGAKVVVSARRRERLDELAAEVQAAGGEALVAVCDVTDEAQVKAAVAAAVERFGRLDVAVANAGFGVMARFDTLEVADWRRQLETNVLGVVATVRHALPELKKTQGRIALVCSVAGQVTAPTMSAYSASKYAVRALGQCLSIELAGSGVTCTTLCPGFVDSEISQVDNRGVYKAHRPKVRPPMTWPTDKAARVMVRAIACRRREYVVTGHGKVFAWFGRHLPGVVHLVLSSRLAQRITPSKP